MLARLQARDDLHALEGCYAGRDRDDVEVVLPVIREPDELVTPGEAVFGRRELLRLEVRFQPVRDRLAVALLQRFERDRRRLVALLAEDLDVGAHAGLVRLAELVQGDLDLEDLDLFHELRRGRDEADLAGEDLLRVRVESDANGLADADLGDVHLVQVDADDERLQVRDREEHRPGVERGNARGHRLAELHALFDDDAAHWRRDARLLRGRVTGDRDAAVLDDLVAHLRRAQGLGGLVALDLRGAVRVAPDEPLLEERLLHLELALGVLELQLHFLDARLHVRERLRLVDVRLDLGEHVALADDRPLAHGQRKHAPRDRGLDVHLGDRIDDPDLADGDLEVFGLNLAEAKRRAVPLGVGLFAALGLHQGGPRHDQQDHQDCDPFLLFHEKTP